MSVNQPPSEKTDYYNPIYYNKGAEDEVTFEDLAGKVDRVGGVIVNGSFQGGEFETRLQAQDLTSVVKRNEVKQYADVWNANTVCYFDFSDPNNMGTDVTNHGRDATVMGAIQYVTDPTRTHAVKFPLQTTTRVFNRTAPGLTLDKDVAAFQTPNWSVSMWANLDPVTVGSSQNFTLFASCKTTGTLTGAFLLIQSGNLIYKTYNGAGTSVTTLTAPFGVATGVWAHVVVSSSHSGMVVYVNGVSTITSSDPLSCMDPYTKQLDAFVIGAVRETPLSALVPNRRFDPWVGLLSDVSIYSIALTQADVSRLYADDYGYAVYTLAGQSNMIGRAQVVAGIDTDYSKLGNRVWQYDTYNNVQAGTGTSVIPATNPLRHPQAGGAGGAGLWRTFAIDLLAYGNIAWRRKIMLVPCGWGGTGFASTDQSWVTGGPLSNVTIAATNNAMGLNPLNSFVAFLWNQGESDVSAKNMNYRQNMQDMLALFAASITGFSSTSTPVILCEISQVYYESVNNSAVVPSVSMISQIRADMDALCAENPANYRLVLTRDMQPMVTDGPHWDIESTRTIGSRYFDALSNIKGGFDRHTTVSIVGSLSLANPVFTGTVTGVTKAHVGLTNVDNTSDASKPVSTAVASALSGLAPLASPAFTGTVTGITKTMVGLANVDNTADSAKPVSTAVASALNGKAPVVSPVFLSYSTFGHTNPVTASADILAQYGATRTSITNNLMGNNEYEVDYVKNGNSWSIPTRLGFAWMMQTNATAIALVNLMQLRHNGNLETVGLISGPTITALESSIAALESGKATAASVTALSSTVSGHTTDIANLQSSNASVATMQSTINGYATSFTTGTLTHNLRRASMEILSASKTYTTANLIDTIVIRGNGCVVTLPYINDYAFNGVMVTVYVDGPHSGSIQVAGDQIRYGAGDLTNHPSYFFDKGRCIQLMAITNGTVALGYAQWTVLG